MMHTPLLAMTARIVRAVATRGRLIAMSAIGLIGIAISVLIANESDNTVTNGLEFLEEFGFTIFVPLVVLVVASATLGTFRDDRNLVYFWLRPIGRWQIALAGVFAGVAVVVPLILVPLGVMAAVLPGTSVGAAILAGAFAIVAYGALFTLLGLVTTRALAWGLGYILVWEGFLSSLSDGMAQLAIRTYASTILRDATTAGERVIDSVGPAQAMIAVVATALVGFGLTTWRLGAMEID